MNSITTPEQLKEHLESQNIRGIALDIDETLTPTNHHWIKILSKKFGRPNNYSDKEIVEHYRYTQLVPQWNTEEARALMHKMANSNKIQEKLPLIENADHETRRIHNEIPIVAYISARPEKVRSGTVRWLMRHEFPQAPAILRPNEIEFDDMNAWKASVLEYLYPVVQGIVDDNPRLIESLSPEYKGFVLLYDHHQTPETSLDVDACPSWKDAHKKIKALLKNAPNYKMPTS